MTRPSNSPPRTPGLIVLLAAFVLAAGCDAPVPGEDPEARGVLVLEGGLVFTSPHADPIEDGVVVVLDGVIEAVGVRGQVPIPAAARRVPISNLSVVSGLWNADVGLPVELLELAETATDEELSEALEERFIRHGFVTIVETAHSGGALDVLMERIRSGAVAGPRILPTGAGIPTGMERARGGGGPGSEAIGGAGEGAPDRSAELAERGIALIPSLTRAGYPGPQESIDQADERRERALAETVRFAGLGGDIVFGSGSGYVPQYDPSTDYMLMDDAGIPPAALLASLTVNPADRLGHDYTGRIEPGMVADLVVVEGDPLADPLALTRVLWVLKEGITLYNVLGR